MEKLGRWFAAVIRLLIPGKNVGRILKVFELFGVAKYLTCTYNNEGPIYAYQSLEKFPGR